MTKFQRIALPVLLLGLGLGFWRSEAFLTVAAGVAVFLFGMMSLERGFQSLSGGWMEHWLQRLTNSTGKSVSLGVVSTSLMQSSSLISLLSISFLSAGLISLSSGLAIIFGANLGTTSGAWLIAGFGLKVNLSDLALPLLVFGIVLQLQSRPSWRSLGHLLTGIGFLFLGIQFMKDGFSNLQSQMQLTAMPFQGFTALLLFTGLGIIATVVMQSSHATLILILTALAHQQIHYEDALAVAIGANIGTTVTAILGSISANAA
ncbi:MAG: sodium:phosphate symporter, partial [Thalassobium sp.]